MDSMILVKIPVLWIGTYLISSALAKIYLVFAHPGYTPSEHRWLEAKEDGNIPSDTAYEQFRQKERTHGSYYWTKRDDQELLN